MTQTFTPVLEIPASNTENAPENRFPDLAEPSLKAIQNILNYSRNLEVKKSRLVDAIEVIKS